MRLHRVLSDIIGNERGTSTIEYGLILAFIVLVMLIALQALATQTVLMWNDNTVRTSAAMSKN